MDTQPSRPVTREKPVPVSNRRGTGVFTIASLIGVGLGLIGGIVTGFIVLPTLTVSDACFYILQVEK